jgi:hypothetical protein
MSLHPPTPEEMDSTPSAGSVTLAMMANLAANSIILNNTGSPATPIAGTPAQSVALILSGSGIVWDATNLSLLLGGAATSANASLAVLANKTVASPVAGTVWNGLDVQASTLTLAAGGSAPSSLSLAHIAAPIITSAAAYTIPLAATLTIDGPPVAAGSLTITNSYALRVAAGLSRFAGPIDAVSGLRVTGIGSSAFTSGVGLEFDYGLFPDTARILSYDRTGSVFKKLLINASTIALQAGGLPTVQLTSGGSLVVGAAIATNTTDGFLYIPTCAGTPTGVPTVQAGTVPMVYDTVNHVLCIYDGGSWT